MPIQWLAGEDLADDKSQNSKRCMGERWSNSPGYIFDDNIAEAMVRQGRDKALDQRHFRQRPAITNSPIGAPDHGVHPFLGGFDKTIRYDKTSACFQDAGHLPDQLSFVGSISITVAFNCPNAVNRSTLNWQRNVIPLPDLYPISKVLSAVYVRGDHYLGRRDGETFD